MISFYPGPSKLYDTVPLFMQEACEKGVLSINHRSPEFVEISKKAVTLLKEKLRIPDSYTVFFTSSATECWEIIAQSVITKGSIQSISFGINETLPIAPVGDYEELLFCLTQNETSNGTEVSNESISQLRKLYPENLFAVDATSSMGGIFLDFSQADIWYASVQKCFGMPAGMALLICSPKAIEKAKAKNDTKFYNSLIFMAEKMEEYQTTYTPNVLAIFLLSKILEQLPDILTQDILTKERAKNWYDFFIGNSMMKLLVKNESVRSATVIAVEPEQAMLAPLKQEAKLQSLLLGNGYGTWKNNTFRIANFPAHTPSEIAKLKEFLTQFQLKG
jgi:phosphoserine aminotransferase